MQKVILEKKFRPTIHIHIEKKTLLGSHSTKQCISDTTTLVKLLMICVPAGPDIGHFMTHKLLTLYALNLVFLQQTAVQGHVDTRIAI